MYKTFGTNRDLYNAISEALMFLFIVAMLLFLLVLFYAEQNYAFAVMAFVLATLLSMVGIDAIRQRYRAFPLVMTDYHLVCSYPMAKRRVYDLSSISWFIIKRKRLLFVADGWPVVVYVKGLDDLQRQELEQLLTTKIR